MVRDRPRVTVVDANTLQSKVTSSEGEFYLPEELNLKRNKFKAVWDALSFIKKCNVKNKNEYRKFRGQSLLFFVEVILSFECDTNRIRA